MLHGHAGGLGELGHQVPGGLGVQVVVEAHGLPLKHLGLEQRPPLPHHPVEGRLLVGVLPVTQGGLPPEGQKLLLGELLPGKPLGDGGVVEGGVGEGLAGELLAEVRGGPRLERLQDPGVVLGVAHGKHRLVVLGRRPEHGGAPDVNLLQGLRKGGPRATVSRKG